MTPPVSDLQARAAAFHRHRHPTAEAHHVALKMGEEVGEVFSAVLAHVLPSDTGKGTIPDECADVMICLLALLGRYYPRWDLLAEVDKKLTWLEATYGTEGHHDD